MTGYDDAASASSDDEDFNSFNFWKAPIAVPPDAEAPPPPPPPAPTTSDERLPSFSLNEPAQYVVTVEQIRKLDKVLKPTPVDQMSTADIQARLAEFEADFCQRHGRSVALSDVPQLPKPVLEMYDQLGRRLSPEDRAKAQERLEARQAAERAAQALAEAQATAEAEKRAAAVAARAKEWEAFEANKEAAWRAAASAAREQREEVAAEHGLRAASLTGASTWLKVDEEPARQTQTKAEMIEQIRLERGLRARPDELTVELIQHEAAEWSAKGGAEADALAREEVCTARAKQQPSAASTKKPLVKVLGPANNPQRRNGTATVKEAPVVVRAVPIHLPKAAQAVESEQIQQAVMIR